MSAADEATVPVAKAIARAGVPAIFAGALLAAFLWAGKVLLDDFLAQSRETRAAVAATAKAIDAIRVSCDRCCPMASR